MVNEGIKMKKVFVQTFYAVLTLSCVGLFIYCFLMLLDKEDPWSLMSTFIVVYAGK